MLQIVNSCSCHNVSSNMETDILTDGPEDEEGVHCVVICMLITFNMYHIITFVT